MKKFFSRILASGVALTLTGGVIPAFAAPAAVGVQLNGVPFSFPDAVPQARDGRTFLPLRAIFEALNADVSIQGNVITVVRGSRTVTITIGSPQVHIVDGATQWEIEMDAVPYVDSTTWRTYMPIRFAAQALDCAVGWDADAYTAVLIDPETLIRDATPGKTFSLLGQFTEYARKYDQGLWEMNLDFHGNMLVDGQTVPLSGSASGGVEDGVKLDMQLNMRMDLSQVPNADPTAAHALAEDGFQMAMRGDLHEDVFYMNLSSPTWNTESGFDPAVWYTMNTDEALAQSGFGGGLNAMLTVSAQTGTRAFLAQLPNMADVNSVLAYDRLKAAVAAFADDAFLAASDVPNRQAVSVTLDTSVLTLALDLTDGVVSGYTYAAQARTSAEDGTPVRQSVSVSAGAQDQIQAETLLKTEEGQILTQLTMEGRCVRSGRLLETRPPADAQIAPLQ